MSSGETPDRGTKRTHVLDPAWEDALRAGQAEDGLSGSVEPELAIVHLLRHARGPEPLDDARFDRAWAAIDEELGAAAPVPWWKRPWSLVGGTAALAAVAAVVLVVVLPRGPDPAPDPARGAGAGSAGAGPVASLGGQADALERQFHMLAPGARDRVAGVVDEGRGKMRDDLLAKALKSGGGTLGGAP